MMIGKVTKAQRREERKTLGTLEELLVKKKTLDKYHSHFNRFCEWAELNEIPLTNAYDFDSAASQYVEGLWADGFGRAEGSYVLAALQHMLPMLKHQLNLAWRLMKTWSKNELPARAVPLDAATVLGFAGLFWVWEEFHLAAGILVAFDFFLRTGELFTLRRQHVEFFASQASLQLTHTKSTTYQIHSERLLAWDTLAIGALRFLACNKTFWSHHLQLGLGLCGTRQWSFSSFKITSYNPTPWDVAVPQVPFELVWVLILCCCVEGGPTSVQPASI